MILKIMVEEVLKKKKRSLSWLSVEMEKSVDGLRLSLVRESIKYADIKRMSEILEVSPAIFFGIAAPAVREPAAAPSARESKIEYSDVRYYKEMCEVLKDQINDKEKIIQLLSGA